MMHTAIYALVISILINLIMFGVAYKKQTDKLTDISYAITFAVLVVYAFLQSGRDELNYLVLIVVLLWAARLGGFLLYRVSKTGKDARFDNMRSDFFKFLKFWFFQGLTVWLLMLPVFALSSSDPKITALTATGFLVWLLGFVVEAVADYQKFKFTQNSKNTGSWITTGIWYYSRHPNYFGEILVWIGMYLLVLPSLSVATAIVSLLSPIYITTLLLFVSGIPILEKSADKKWGSNKNYVEYKNSTSLIIPLPKRSR